MIGDGLLTRAGLRELNILLDLVGILSNFVGNIVNSREEVSLLFAEESRGEKLFLPMTIQKIDPRLSDVNELLGGWVPLIPTPQAVLIQGMSVIVGYCLFCGSFGHLFVSQLVYCQMIYIVAYRAKKKECKNNVKAESVFY